MNKRDKNKKIVEEAFFGFGWVCPTHKKYLGIHEPRAKCLYCYAIYMKNLIRAEDSQPHSGGY